MHHDEVERLLSRKCELTPSQVMRKPREPFPWHQVPYLHHIFEPSATYAQGAVTTDEIGLRRVVIGGKHLGFRQFQKLTGRKGILLGASTALSMGASSDAKSIASQLSSTTEAAWFNLAVGGYVSTQEFFLYCLLNPLDISDVVVLSGLNTLSAYAMDPAGSTDDVFPPHMYWAPGDNDGLLRSVLRRSVDGCSDGKLARYLRRMVRSRRARTLRMREIREITDLQVATALIVTRKNLQLLGDLCRARGARLTFVAQPLLSVLRKHLTPEESEISEIQATLGAYSEFALWGLYADEIAAVYPKYCQDLGVMCEELKIEYHDLNRSPEFLDGERWLFTDFAHFTDAGYAICAESIRRATLR